MTTIIYQLTVKELLKYCQVEMQKGNGDKHIVVSNDNEGNGFHGLFYAFTDCTEEYQDSIYDSCYSNEKDTIILG